MGYGVKLNQVMRLSDWVYNTDWGDKAESPGFIIKFLSIIVQNGDERKTILIISEAPIRG